MNGHAFPEVDSLKIDVHYKDRAILYHNDGGGRFRDISDQAGAGILEKHSSRGAAFADIDNDGKIAIAVNNQGETPSLLIQQASSPGHWIIVKLEGTRSNRNAIGARVTVRTNGHSQLQEVRSGGSYLSQSDLRLHFGLGTAATVDRIEITWPGSRKQIIEHQKADRVVTIREE